MSARLFPPSPLWCCQFCKSGLHRSCPGAVRTPKGPPLLCICAAQDAGHPSRPRCLDCRETRSAELDVEKWVCVDKLACSVRVQQRCDSNPIYRMIRACQVSADNDRRVSRTVYQARIRAGLPDDEDEQYDAAHARPRSAPKSKTGTCLCCGAPTKGGRFLPGHDARHRGALLRRIRQGDPAAVSQARESMIELGWLDHK